MSNITLEFDINGKKISRFNIRNQPDEIFWMANGDEVGFDLVEASEYFYATISRKVFITGADKPLYIICVPINFPNLEELSVALERFKTQFGENLVIDTTTA
jgi:hypothetical protein